VLYELGRLGKPGQHTSRSTPSSYVLSFEENVTISNRAGGGSVEAFDAACKIAVGTAKTAVFYFLQSMNRK
jgi:hypothetical protein